MIAVDTSALMAIILDEPEKTACMKAVREASAIVISAGTLAELFVVSGRRGVQDTARVLVDQIGATIVPVTADDARRVGKAYDLWGKGVHPAGLNLGDCFAYVLAASRNCPLLFVGNDFAQTDLVPAS